MDSKSPMKPAQTEIDDVSEIIRCKICSKLYQFPITLPCGETCCQSHLNEFDISPRDRKFKCDLCNTEHILPENGFQDKLNFIKTGVNLNWFHKPVPTSPNTIDEIPIKNVVLYSNKAIQKMLDINIDRLDRGEAYKNAKASFEILNSKFETYELVNTVPAFFIDEYFSNVINEIDLRRDEIKLEIDNYYDKIINDLKQAQKSCVVMSESNRRVSNDELKFFRKEVESFNKDLKMLDLDEHKWKNIETKSKILVNKIEFKLKEIKEFFLLSKSYEFKQPEIKLDANILGRLDVKPLENLLNFNREIMKLKQDFQNKLNEGSSKKYKITTYDEIKTWSECSEHVQKQHKIDDVVIKNILANSDQSDHLKFINGLEAIKKNYTVVTSAELSNDEGCYFFRILKDFNQSYSHEFLNDLGFLILVKNPKFERV